MLKHLIVVLLLCSTLWGARSFNNTGERLSDSTPSGLDLTAFTICSWAYVVTSPAVGGTIFTVQVGANGHSLLIMSSTNQVQGIRTTSWTARSALSTETLTANTWYCVCSTYDGVGSAPKVFISSGEGISTTMAEVSYASQTAGTGTDATTPTNTLIGNNSAFNRTFLGRLAEILVYTTALTVDEMTSLSRGYPVSGAVCYVPLLGRVTPELDRSGSGNSYVVTSATGVDHAPIAPSFGWWN